MKFRPLHDRVVIKRIEAEEKTSGGIIIPDTAKEKPPGQRHLCLRLRRADWQVRKSRVEGDHRSDQGGPHSAAGCGLDCGPAHHYRGDGRRETQEGDTDACHARWRHGWHGLLIDAEPVLPGRGLGRLLGPSFLTRPSQTMSRVAAILFCLAKGASKRSPSRPALPEARKMPIIVPV